MIALKKLYGDELLRLALVLSLLKVDHNVFEREAQLTAGLHISNGTDWSIENEAGTQIRPSHIHPKSLDNILINYERQIFDELNSLGRYYEVYNSNNQRMWHTSKRSIVHTYVLNNVATDTNIPQIQSVDNDTSNNEVQFVIAQDGVVDDANVGQEVKIPEEDSQSSEASVANRSVTISPTFLHNRTRTEDIFEEIASRSFDVSEFFVTPNEMHIKKEPEDNILDVKIKKETDNNDLYDDNAMDDFVPYFTARSENCNKIEHKSVFDENMADLQDYGELLEEVKHDFELDVKQENGNLEKYLLENTPLDEEDFDIAATLEDGLLLDVKRERTSVSFTSASSSGVSELDVGAEEIAESVNYKSESVNYKSESDEGHHTGDELTQEDMDLIEVLWKQDVDMGFCLDNPIQPGAPQATKVELSDEIDKELKLAEEKIQKEKHEKEKIEKVKASLLEEPEVDTKEDDPWAGLSYTVDTETGEYVLQGELPRELVSEESRFDLLEEALQLVELGEEDPPKNEEVAKPAVDTPEPSEQAAAMLHPAMARHAIPHHHPLAHYHNQTLMRSMSVEQRWQDLASLLTIPPPPPEQYGYPHHHHQQHPHNMSSHGPAGYPPNYGAMPPPPDKHSEAYGAAAPIESAYKVESAHHPQQHEGIYYQNGTGPEMGNSDGFLQSILNDEDLQLMDMAMNEARHTTHHPHDGMYTMRMLDGSSGPPAHPHPAASHVNHTHMMVTERDSASDSAVSSMGSERVPSLSDGEWCDAGSDSAQEYHSSKFRPYDASFNRDRSTASGSQPPQKKHHMFGKRCFQEPQPSNLEPLVPEPQRLRTVKYEYPDHHTYHPDNAMAIPPPHEFTARHQVPHHHPHIPTLQPALDMNTAHSSHALVQAPVPNVPRFGSPYSSERVRHNHTYSAPLTNLEPRPAVRDKRVRRLTDESMSDSGSTTNSHSHHLTRDEKRAKALGIELVKNHSGASTPASSNHTRSNKISIPMEVQEIINLPMDEFNERLSKHDLSEAQLSLIRDIRRRGKNKVAAQNCRKRKLDQITSLADEVRTVRDRKIRTQRDHQSLMAERQRVKERFAALYRHVFQNLRDAEGRPLSSNHYSLQQAADGNVVLVPKMTQNNEHPMNRTDEDMDRKSKNFDQ